MRLLLLLLRHPFAAAKFTYTWLAQSLLVLLRQTLLPHVPSYQSLRLQLQRAYLSSASITFPDVTHRLPVGAVSEARAKHIRGLGFDAYLIPGARSDLLNQRPENGRRRCIALYAHGGGYARGEAKMYLNYMERWVGVAAAEGIELAFLSVEYRKSCASKHWHQADSVVLALSIKASHPAQRDSFISAYQFLLKHGIPPGEIIFMGDSAGGEVFVHSTGRVLILAGGLCVLSSIHCQHQHLPQPAGSVLISPWMDMTMRAHVGGNALVETDYVIHANQSTPVLVSQWLNGCPPDSPEANPLYRNADEIPGLNPQLILVGAGEFALRDSIDWAALCATAGVKHQLVREWGQLHIYALGSKWLAPKIRQRTEHSIIDWIKMCLTITTSEVAAEVLH